jgi:hypothetical protein
MVKSGLGCMIIGRRLAPRSGMLDSKRPFWYDGPKTRGLTGHPTSGPGVYPPGSKRWINPRALQIN